MSVPNCSGSPHNIKTVCGPANENGMSVSAKRAWPASSTKICEKCPIFIAIDRSVPAIAFVLTMIFFFINSFNGNDTYPPFPNVEIASISFGTVSLIR